MKAAKDAKDPKKIRAAKSRVSKVSKVKVHHVVVVYLKFSTQSDLICDGDFYVFDPCSFGMSLIEGMCDGRVERALGHVCMDFHFKGTQELVMVCPVEHSVSFSDGKRNGQHSHVFHCRVSAVRE